MPSSDPSDEKPDGGTHETCLFTSQNGQPSATGRHASINVKSATILEACHSLGSVVNCRQLNAIVTGHETAVAGKKKH